MTPGPAQYSSGPQTPNPAVAGGAKCPRCDGCGRIADSDDGEPWTVWENLPLRSATAVLIGLVKPIPCPDCGGSGVAP